MAGSKASPAQQMQLRAPHRFTNSGSRVGAPYRVSANIRPTAGILRRGCPVLASKSCSTGAGLSAAAAGAGPLAAVAAPLSTTKGLLTPSWSSTAGGPLDAEGPTCGEDHVNEAKAEQESRGQEEVGTYPVEAITIGNGGVEGGANLVWKGCQPGGLSEVCEYKNWVAEPQEADLQTHSHSEQWP
ncbi:MAG: hypothetical protein FRX49_09442 [Trebouxia sp. A1-2]|nr:MAG: hypothetical protein FRX49_09442 [Trebouxia sp. A1-2]